MAHQYKQGEFTPTNRAKYRGKWPIIYRSSWELRFDIWCDKNQSVVQWGSESSVVRYVDPVKKNSRNYFIDYVIVVKDKNGKLSKWYVEIKPYCQTIVPVKGHKRDSTYLRECMTFATNSAKWKAAQEWASKKGAQFIVLTENELMKSN